MALKHWKRKFKSGKMVLALLMQIALLKRQGALNGDIANKEVANVLQIWTALMIILSVLSGDSASLPLTNKEEEELFRHLSRMADGKRTIKPCLSL